MEATVKRSSTFTLAPQVADVPLLASADIVRSDEQGEETESEADGAEDDPVVRAPTPPSEWRVPVAILSYQTTPFRTFAWVARGESAESWLRRVSILFAPHRGDFEILLPGCQQSTTVFASCVSRSGGGAKDYMLS